ncbi:MAG: S9 family peptidase [Candidatus Thermoplasmatota archaeon]
MSGLKIEDLADFDFLSNVRYSPNERHIAFNKHTMDLEENEYISNIWIRDEEKGEVYRLTNSGKDKDFVWLNENEILFVSERDMGVKEDGEENENKKEEKEKTNLFKINIQGGEAQHFDTIEKKVSGIKIYDSTLLLSLNEKIEDEGVEPDEEKEKDEKEKENKFKLEEGEDYHELDEIPFWSNEGGFSNKKRNHLYSYDIEEKNLQLLVGGTKTIQDFDVEDDQVCMNIIEYEDKLDPANFLYHLDIENGELSQLTEEELVIERVRFLTQDKIIFEATDMEEMGRNTNKELYVYDLDKDRKQQKTQMDKSIGNTVMTDLRFGGGESSAVKDEEYYFTVTEGHNVNLYRFDSKEKVKELTDLEGTIDFFDISEEEVAHVGFRENRGQELYTLDLKTGDEERITSFNEMDKEICKPEHFTIRSNGKEIDAWVIKPIGFEENADKKYPTILEIHGGPKTVFGEILFHELQVLADQGYAVIISNILGSSGKGNEFADIIGKYGGEDLDDLMNVVEAAEEKFDFIDEKNWGVTGGSYGGYMTNWIITQTDKFQAAVSQRCISNWISMFCTTDIGYYFVEDQFEETPWTSFEGLWERSPLKYADKADTPILFIHSRKDYRCWESEPLQMFTALKFHDNESKAVLFEDENHDLSRSGRPKQRMMRLKEMVEWFEKFIESR